MVWPMIAAAAASAIAGIVGSKAAADSQARSGRNAVQEQRRQFDTIMGLQQPWMVTGTGALNQLASLYGLPYQPYQSPQNIAAMQPYTTGGKSGGSSASNLLSSLNSSAMSQFGGGGGMGMGLPGMGSVPGMDVVNSLFGLGGDSNAPYTATINPQTGTVDVKGGHNNLDAAMTAYLRGEGEAPTGGHGRYSQIKRAIEDMRANGYMYNADTSSGSYGTAGQPATASAQPTGMAGFTASPDYQFRLSEGTRAIDRSAAARGGALSGNALRAQTGYASNLAAGEYGNYVNRLLAMAGLGQTATNSTSGYAYGTGNSIGNTMQNIGDARASGILGGAGALQGLFNSFGSLYGQYGK